MTYDPRPVTNRAALLLGILLATTLIAPSSHAQGLKEGTTTDGRRYVAGGIGIEEVAALQQQAPGFSLQLITAAPSGAYLAGTEVRITDASNAVVLETTIDAPWLLVDLPGGRYTVRASHPLGGEAERRLTIAEGKPQRVVLNLHVPVDQDPPGNLLSPGGSPRVPQ
jgi:hypothetical protein